MKYIVFIAASAGAMISTAAVAAPIGRSIHPSYESQTESVRLVCNEYGRCWRTRGPRYVIRDYDDYRVRRSYGYYGGGPGYYHRPAAGIELNIGGRGW